MKSKQKPDSRKKQPALTLVFETWSIPVIGLAMFLVGMFAGYSLQMRDIPQNLTEEGLTQDPTQPPVGLGGSNQAVMDYIQTQVRHFEGDPNAPVTLIEFGDFQ